MKINELPTPCFVIDETKLIHNLEILKEVEKTYWCKDFTGSEMFFLF